MAFSAGIGDRNDDLRYRTAQSPRDETSYNSVTSPLRSIGGQMSGHISSAGEARGSLHRRFTTNTVPTLPVLSPLSPIGQQRRQAAEQPDFNTATFHKVQLLEKKKLEYEYLREQRRRFEAEMELIDRQARREEDEMTRLAHDLNRAGMSGRQSEPTTPPEYRENGFPNAFSKPNRYSSASLTSPPGLVARPGRSGSQITSPPHGHSHSQSISHIPSKSMPGSRRGSDEEEDDYEYELATVNHRSAASMNRNSMPVTGLDLTNHRLTSDIPDLASVLGQIDTTKFLFDDHEDRNVSQRTPIASPDRKSFFHMNTTNDKDNFPILIRRDDNNHTMQYSGSSAALDLATSQSPAPEKQSNGWGSGSFATRHRQAQHSLPMNTLRSELEDLALTASNENNKIHDTPSKSTMKNRHSMESSSKFSPFGNRSAMHVTPPSGATGMPKLQSSFSTNDIPTVKNPNGVNGAVTPTALNTHAEQHFHNHNASMGRIPQGVMSNRQSRDLTGADLRTEEPKSAYSTFRLPSALHASAAPFGPSLTQASQASNGQNNNMSLNQNANLQYGASAFYTGYGMQTGMQTINGINMFPQPQPGPQNQWGNGLAQMYQNPYQQYGPHYQQYAAGGRFTGDSQTRVVQSRKTTGGGGGGQDQNNRFQDFDLMTGRKEILGLCKDQYGCRFLQKKLEEQNVEFTEAIFAETKHSVIELMTDPFGNYLCQKLLEFTNDDQRTVLMRNAAPQMVGIALNQHGTRALQKMIEYVRLPEQITTIIEALQSNVVPLIQDLNGNHVIQKCLNHLKSVDAQFIFAAVGLHCVEVGTHRHGCCVLQRCIDHASGDQRNLLIHQITENAIDLVQDPFGNYVVQYILDLNEQKFTQPLCHSFLGKVIALSRQKFSSNVVEKCIRVANHEIKRGLIEELLQQGELEQAMRDPYANYVIQTSLDYADNDTSMRLIEAIRPIIPAIRQTPYGRRIQTKIQEREARLAQGSGPALIDTAALASSPMASPQHTQALPNRSEVQATKNVYGGMGSGFQNSVVSPQPHRLNGPSLPSHLQSAVHHQGHQGHQQGSQQHMQPFGRAPQPSYGSNGHNFF